MATIIRERSGFYRAQWLAGDGSKQSAMTGHRDFDGAIKEANHLEATARFWEAANEGIFSFMANVGFSPDYAHANFSHKGHIKISEFRKLLRDAQIQFKKPSQWQDSKNPAKKKYRFQNKNVTINEALMITGIDITVSAVRKRLNIGWKFEDAVTRPVRTKKTA